MVFQRMPPKEMLRGLKTLVRVTSSTQAVAEFLPDLVAKMYRKLPCAVLTTPGSTEYLPMPLKEMLRGPKTLVQETSNTRADAEFPPDLVAKMYHNLL